MPTRILREGILTSQRVNSLSLRAELFYRRLISVHDDHGRYYAHPSLLRAACFPYQLETWSEADVKQMLSECISGRVITLYGADKYLQVLNSRQQRRGKSKFPEPTEAEALIIRTAEDNQMRSDAEAEAEAYAKAKAYAPPANPTTEKTTNETTTQPAAPSAAPATGSAPPAPTGDKPNDDPTTTKRPPGDEPKQPLRSKSRQKPDSVEQCIAAAGMIGLTEADARQWFKDYELCEWRRGDGSPFENWQREMVIHRDKLRSGRPARNHAPSGAPSSTLNPQTSAPLFAQIKSVESLIESNKQRLAKLVVPAVQVWMTQAQAETTASDRASILRERAPIIKEQAELRAKLDALNRQNL